MSTMSCFVSTHGTTGRLGKPSIFGNRSYLGALLSDPWSYSSGVHWGSVRPEPDLDFKHTIHYYYFFLFYNFY